MTNGVEELQCLAASLRAGRMLKPFLHTLCGISFVIGVLKRVARIILRIFLA